MKSPPFALENRRCKHNINYWEFGDYLGIGAGAHGKISTAKGIERLWKIKHPKTYLTRSSSGDMIGGRHKLGASEIPLEFMMNALRLPPGFALPLFEQRTGQPISAIEVPLIEAQKPQLDTTIRAKMLAEHSGLSILKRSNRTFFTATIIPFLYTCVYRTNTE